jgi:chromate reductase, NAD(P)H dehydrogenase (quinone)
MPQILALNGSLRAASANHRVLEYLRAASKPPLTIVPGPALDALPHFNPDLDIDPAPAAVATLRAQIANADALLICTPEYTFSIPGSLKNALDWLVSSGSLYEKPVAIVATSTSRGLKVLAALADVLAAHQARIAIQTALHPAEARTHLTGDAAPHSATGRALAAVLAALGA